MNIGEQSPSWKTPCLSNGRIEYVSLRDFHGKPLILCCMPALAEIDAWLLETQVHEFHDCEMVLAILVAGDPWIRQHWIRPPHEFRLKFFTDPLGRLRRTLHPSPSLPSHQSETLLFDQNSRLNFRLLHELNLRNLAKVLEVSERTFSRRSHLGLWKKPVPLELLPALCFKTEKSPESSTLPLAELFSTSGSGH